MNKPSDIIVDSNIIIYAAKPEGKNIIKWFASIEPYISLVSMIEVYGFPGLDSTDKIFFDRFFDIAISLSIDRTVLNNAISLRQQRRMSLGDAIIAGTALTHDLTLATHNTKDFAWIDGLNIVDPLDG